MKGRIEMLIVLGMVVLLLGPSLACRKKGPADAGMEIFSEEQLWAQSQEALEKKKWRKATEYLKLLLDQYPSGPHVREAHIAYADTLFRRGGNANLIEAQAKYLSFVAFYPEDERTPYAQFRVALCNYERRSKANRDQLVTRDAIAEFEKVIQNHPTSEFVGEARAKLAELRDELAEHEMLVAEFYRRRGFDESVVRRVKFLLDKYPEYTQTDRAYLLLGETLLDLDNGVEAEVYFARLLDQYPDSELRKAAEKGRAAAERLAARQEKRREKERSRSESGGDEEPQATE